MLRSLSRLQMLLQTGLMVISYRKFSTNNSLTIAFPDSLYDCLLQLRLALLGASQLLPICYLFVSLKWILRVLFLPFYLQNPLFLQLHYLLFWGLLVLLFLSRKPTCFSLIAHYKIYSSLFSLSI